jgi:hypothetical protein
MIMRTRQDYLKQPLSDRLARMARTPDDLASAIRGGRKDLLGRRPDAKNWAATEVICHLRDIEEQFIVRFHLMLGTKEPTFLTLGDMPPNPEHWGIRDPIGMPLDPARWAEERQYLRCDAGEALSALRRRREETLLFLSRLTKDEWQRGSQHVILGRMTFEDWTALIAVHDDRHLAQLERALRGEA